MISPKKGEIRGWKMKDWGDKVPVDRLLSEARVDEYDGLVLPAAVTLAATALVRMARHACPSRRAV